MDNRLATLRRILRIHVNWLTVKLLGKELVSKEDLAELKDYGRLPLGDEVGLVERSFILGRTSATGKKSEYKELTLDKLSMLQKRKFSNAEQLALREAKLHTARRIQALSDDAAAGASARVNSATQELLTDATVKEILEDEIAIALAEKKSRKELATTVGNALGRDLTSGLKKLMVTEMHRAKTRGVAMAIANKVDIYSSSEGAESIVSVVPNREACEDCRNLYLTDIGNPKVFKLKDLVGQGSNSDPGVSHSRTGGLHTGWKPVLPPAHPNCFCELTYVPAGMEWIEGKLKVTDELRYKNQISKAVDQSQLSAKTKPPGGKKYQGPDTPKVGSIPGVPAPGNVPGPGADPSPQSVAEAAMPTTQAVKAPAQDPTTVDADQKWELCPYGGDKECIAHGGQGAEKHERNGEEMKAHMEYDDFPGSVEEQEQKDPVQEAEQLVYQLRAIEDFRFGSNPREQEQKDLSTGDIARRMDIRDVPEVDDPGISTGQVEVERIDIVDNGSGLMKPPLLTHPHSASNEVGAACVHEVYGSPNNIGGHGRAPCTTYRVEENEKKSVQGWIRGTNQGKSLYEKAAEAGEVPEKQTTSGTVKFLLERSKNKEKTRADIEETCCADIITCNTDRHLGNMLFDDENAYAIDHGFAFGRGMSGLRNHYHEGMEGLGMEVHVPASMREKIENTSFDQLYKGLSEHTTTWRAAQTYLRAKYLLHVEDRYGKIPYKDIGGGDSHGQMDRLAMGGTPAYGDRGARFPSGNAKFESFAFKWIDKRAADPSHPDHLTALQFQEEGIFMDVVSSRAGQAGRKQGDQERREGMHLKYEKFARSHAFLLASASHDKFAMNDPAKIIDSKIRLDAKRIDNERDAKEEEINVKIDNIVAATRKVKFPGGNINRNLTQDQEDWLASKGKEITHLRLDAQRLVGNAKIEKLKSRMEIVSKVVPPGQEEIYASLDNRIAAIEQGKKPGLDIKLNTGVSTKQADDSSQMGTVPITFESAAASIESKKQGRWAQVLEKIKGK